MLKGSAGHLLFRWPIVDELCWLATICSTTSSNKLCVSISKNRILSSELGRICAGANGFAAVAVARRPAFTFMRHTTGLPGVEHPFGWLELQESWPPQGSEFDARVLDRVRS
jgi:hypothetical protein